MLKNETSKHKYMVRSKYFTFINELQTLYSIPLNMGLSKIYFNSKSRIEIRIVLFRVVIERDHTMKIILINFVK